MPVIRLDSSAAIRWVDEPAVPQSWYNLVYTHPVVNGTFNIPPSRTSPGAFVTGDVIDAEFTEVPDKRVDSWNTVWAQIGEAYNKKVFCIEG